MRFSLHFLLMVMAFVAAFFAGRASLAPVIREHERLDVMQNQQIQALEKASTIAAMAEVVRQQRLSEEELRHRETMREFERARYPRLVRPELLVPDRVNLKSP
jgi:hypothetical protein